MTPVSPLSAVTGTRRQHGLSLIELMVALTIGLILLAGITTLIVQQSNSRAELEKSSRQIENGRYAMQLLHDDIEHAGYFGDYSPASGVVYSAPTDPCNLATGVAAAGFGTGPITVPAAIYGYVGAATDPTAAPTTSCGLQSYKPNTAILIVRRVSTANPIPTTAAIAGVPYIQASGCNTDASPFVYGTGGFNLFQKDCVTPAQLRPYLVDVYYISTCDVCTPTPDNIPTLKMVQRGGSAAAAAVVAAAPVPLVEGIENMQFEYGLDNSGDGSPDAFPNPTTLASTDWQNVMSVRVNLLARNIECTMGYSDTKTYNLGNFVTVTNGAGITNTCASGDYKRHVYSAVVRVVNPSGRREPPTW